MFESDITILSPQTLLLTGPVAKSDLKKYIFYGCILNDVFNQQVKFFFCQSSTSLPFSSVKINMKKISKASPSFSFSLIHLTIIACLDIKNYF